MIIVPKLRLEDAKIVLEGAEKKAKEIGIDMDIAVVDEGGNLLAFYRMDRAKITSIDVATNKAFTAAGELERELLNTQRLRGQGILPLESM